jgi:peptidoglycan hydrolase-like protein with peptidoglycan-binding domain
MANLARNVIVAVCLTMFGVAATLADELVQAIQEDLAVLGYAPGPPHGELTVETAVAISQFQAANGLAVTGRASTELAETLSPAAERARRNLDGAHVKHEANSQACGRTVADVADGAEKKARGLSRLASAVSRLGRHSKLAQSAAELADASDAAADAAAAAGELTDDAGTGCG